MYKIFQHVDEILVQENVKYRGRNIYKELKIENERVGDNEERKEGGEIK